MIEQWKIYLNKMCKNWTIHYYRACFHFYIHFFEYVQWLLNEHKINITNPRFSFKFNKDSLINIVYLFWFSVLQQHLI